MGPGDGGLGLFLVLIPFRELIVVNIEPGALVRPSRKRVGHAFTKQVHQRWKVAEIYVKWESADREISEIVTPFSSESHV